VFDANNSHDGMITSFLDIFLYAHFVTKGIEMICF